MSNNIVETVIGAVVLGVAALFLTVAYRTTDLAPTAGYELSARFDKVDGLTTGADVRMSGIKIGTVTAAELDRQTLQAVVRVTIDEGIELPSDSSIKVAADGLLGGTFLSVEPGGDENTLSPGGEITYTQGSVNIIELVGKAMYSGGGESN